MKSVRRIFWLSASVVIFSGIRFSQQTIHLKKRQLDAPSDLEAYRTGPLLRRRAERSHYLVQFSTTPTESQVRRLKERGATILNYVPDGAFLVSAADEVSFSGLGLKYAGRV